MGKKRGGNHKAGLVPLKFILAIGLCCVNCQDLYFENPVVQLFWVFSGEPPALDIGGLKSVLCMNFTGLCVKMHKDGMDRIACSGSPGIVCASQEGRL